MRHRTRVVTMVAVLLGLSIGVVPAAADEYKAGRYRVTDVEVLKDEDGAFSARATVTNTGETEDPTPVIGVYFLRDSEPVGEAEGYVYEGFEETENGAPDVFAAGVTHVVTFVGSSYYSNDWNAVRFEIFAGEDE